MQRHKEFKAEALKFLDEIEIKKTAAQLGLHYNTIADWRNFASGAEKRKPHRLTKATTEMQ